MQRVIIGLNAPQVREKWSPVLENPPPQVTPHKGFPKNKGK